MLSTLRIGTRRLNAVALNVHRVGVRGMATDGPYDLVVVVSLIIETRFLLSMLLLRIFILTSFFLSLTYE
jgi:hypothetical protein